VKFYRDLLTGNVDFAALDNHVRAYPTPVNVSMVVNNACNLQCRHCYLQVPTLADRALSEHEWERIFLSALHSDTTMLSLNGKEVFLGAKGPSLLAKLASLRRKLHPAKRIGVITNGTLIARHRKLIDEADLTFLDISVDGLPEDHDAIRGSGAFEQVRPNLEWAAHTLSSRFFVSLTAQKQNLTRFNDAVLHLNRLGVQNVGVSFFHPAVYNDPSLTLSENDYVSLFNRLHAIGSARLDRPLTVFIEVDTLCPEALVAFLRSDWFSLSRIEMDRSRVPWIDYAFPNGFRMQFKFFPIPWAGYHSVRITPEGSVLAVDDIFNTRLYPLRTLATAREHGCDFPAMMRAAQQSPRTRQLLANYFDRLLPKLIAAGDVKACIPDFQHP
jgi:MoaA/NifB/PqqE/SkfB family radical SAM enzyme